MSNKNLSLDSDEPSADRTDYLNPSDIVNAKWPDVNNEEDFGKIRQNSWKEHSEQYTELLTNYVENSKKTLKAKRYQKAWFFVISMAILLIAIISSVVVIYKISTGSNETIDKIINVIPSLLTFFTPLFVVPNLISKYLFNTKDEEHMIEVVKHIISHDDHSVNR